MSLKTNPVSSGYSTGVINSNFEKIEKYVNDNLLNRDGVTPGEPNQMGVDLDMNSQDILNVGKMDAKEIDLGGVPVKEVLDNAVEETTQEANRAKQEADRAKQEADRAEAAGGSNDAYLLNRANHTGTQEISTVEGLSAALGAKANQTSLDAKVDKVEGKGLSTHDFTSAEKGKLGGIEAGAQVNTVTSVNSRTGTVAGLVENTDPRLTDAREWSAAIVAQAEAEAGTGTTRRAWTAQRVRQAIAAWWNTIGTAFGKTLLGSADAAAARDSLGLGTAATRNVGTSDGQVPEFVSNGEGLGGFGYGRVGTSVGRYTDVNDVPKRTGFYLLTDGHPNSTNNKAPLAGFYDTCIVRTLRQGTNDFVDVYLPYHQYSNGMVIAPYTSGGYATQRIVSDSVNLRTSTGQSTLYSMTQKAVTDALDTKANTIDVPSTTALKQASPSILIVDQLRASVEAASGGRMTVLYTASGQPSYMHILPAFNCEDVAPGGELGTGLHPAFLFNGVGASEIFIGAYPASTAQSGGAAVSLPGVDPRASINFDSARNLCKANGPGWDMMSNLDWAAIALWCMANGYEPRGNTNHGRSHEDRWETGRRQGGGIPGNASGDARTLTGSGPAAWAHDGTPVGIHDLVGNVWEWVSGMKLVGGRAWVAPDNGQTEEAQYIDSGFDMISANPWSGHPSEGASDLVKQSLIAPATPALSPQGRLYVSDEGERLPQRGGFWNSTNSAGLGALDLGAGAGRSSTRSTLSFRLRFRAQ